MKNFERLKEFYDKKIPVHIEKYCDVSLRWSDVVQLIDRHNRESLSMMQINNGTIVLDYGFLSADAQANATKINLIGLEENKIYSSHFYISFSESSETFDWHNDSCEVIYLQALGSTKWEIKNYGQYILSEGDIIYCPKEFFHKTTPLTSRVGISYGIR